MKFKVLVEYEYPTEHKLPVKAELVLHGDRVVTDDIEWVDQESVLDKIRAEINTPNRGSCDYFIVDRIEEIINEYDRK